MSGDEVCRLCLSEEGQMEPIFKSTDADLPQKILECTSIKVIDTAELPGFICEVCKSELIIWMKFRRMCLKTNDILKERFPMYFESPNEEKMDESFEVGDAKSNKYIDDEISDNDMEADGPHNILMLDKNEGIEYIVEEAEYEDIADAEMSERTERTIEMKVEKDLQCEETEGDSMGSSNTTSLTTKNRFNGEVVKVVLPNNRVRYIAKCHVCGKGQQNIKQHMRVHFDEKPFKCPYCERAFRQRGNYTRHLNIHTGRKPYKCEECDSAFADPASLRAHKVRHTGSRAYHCDVCGKSFSHSHVLAAHKRIHTQDRRHSCNFCEKRFLSSHSLKKHIRTHTGERPYKCTLCPKAFATSGNLRTHQLVHSKVKSFKCHVCNESFAYRCVLKAHMKKHVKDGSLPLNEEKNDPKHETRVETIQQGDERLTMREAEHSDSDNAYDEVYEVYTE